MGRFDLRIMAARYALGLATTDEVVDAAHYTLERGIYSRSLGEIATFRNPTWSDIGSLFGSVMEELGFQTPTWTEAIDIVTTTYFVALAEETSEPQELISQCYSDYQAVQYNLDGRRKDRNVEPPGSLETLAYRYYQYDHYGDYHNGLSMASEAYRRYLEKLNLESVIFAKKWCRDRWQPILDPEWLTSNVVSLARSIYEEHVFSILPILADALQDAGCEQQDILDHYRGDGPHVRGCWVVDLLLGKE